MRTIKYHCSKGFTLIEMAIVIIIFGLLISMFLPAYQVYLTNQKEATTRDNIKLVQTSIEEFRKRFGRYPLPAPVSLARGQDGYGYESDWDGDDLTPDATPFNGLPSNDALNPDFDVTAHPVFTAGACVGGVCVRPGNRTIDHDRDGGTTAEVTPRVRIGSIPFRILNLDDSKTYDGYGNRFTYAVTERLARTTTYEGDHGSIAIQNLTGENLLDPPDSGHFIVISHGPNESGAYTKGGTQIECAGANTDLANTTCNIAAGNALYVVDTRQADYDDSAIFFLNQPVESWKISESNEQNIYAAIRGGVGVRMQNPQEKLDVNGSIETATRLMASSYCHNVGATDCFDTDFIAGASVEGYNTCPPDQLMVGIMNGQIVCESNVTISCPPGEIMTAIQADGSPSCLDMPDCPSQTTNALCSTPYTLPVGNVGDPPTIFPSVAATPRMSATCTINAGTGNPEWTFGSQVGACPSATCKWKSNGGACSGPSCPTIGLPNLNSNCVGPFACGSTGFCKAGSIRYNCECKL